MKMSKEFSGKVVIVTGASSGIGAGTVIHFAKLGANVVLSGRNLENLNKIADQCKIGGNKPLVVQTDITKAKDQQKLIDSTIEHFSRIDVLVHSAGIGRMGGLQIANLSQLDEVYDINIRTIFQLTKLAIPHLLKTKGNIVNVSSVAAFVASEANIIYCTSKSALNQFTRCLAHELAPQQVRVNSVNPGVIDTQFFHKSGFTEEENQVFMEYAKMCHPLGRIGTVEEVAQAIAFLASDKASFITGVLLPIDGGIQLTNKM